jgi:hypothetical protein
MATIQVRRESRPWRDRSRAWTVVLDGIRIGSVKNGEVFTSEASVGVHRLQLRIDWTGSQSMEFRVDSSDPILIFLATPGPAFPGLLSRDRWIRLSRERGLGAGT